MVIAGRHFSGACLSTPSGCTLKPCTSEVRSDKVELYRSSDCTLVFLRSPACRRTRLSWTGKDNSKRRSWPDKMRTEECHAL